MVHHSWTSSTDSTTILQMVVESVLFLSFSAMICWICPFLLWYFDLIGGFNPLKNMKVRLDHHPKYWGSHKIPWFQTTNQWCWEAMIWILPWHPLANSQEAHDIPVILIVGYRWLQSPFFSPVFASGTSNRVSEHGLVCRLCIHILFQCWFPWLSQISRGYLGFLKDPQQIKTSSYRLPTCWIYGKSDSRVSPLHPQVTL